MSCCLDDRYELLDELPHVSSGRLFRARDLAFDEFVGVKQLGPYCGLGLEPRQQLENTIRHLQCLSHPHLFGIYHFDSRSGLIVQEWVQGISLLDLLRRRRELSIGEAVLLLSALPATLDFLAREAVPIPRPLLGKLYVEFGDHVATENLAGTPLDRWPAFSLKLNPLSLRGLMTDATRNDTTTHTVVVDPRRPTEIQEGHGPHELALLLYELLGGRIREVDNRRYSPLSSLREAGNAVLSRELAAMPHTDCQSLWRDLLQAQSDTHRLPPPAKPEAATVRKYRIPEAFLSCAHPGNVLNLESDAPRALPIHLVAGPRFTVGRSDAMADFVTRVLPESEANDARTNRLGRVHAVLELNDRQITLRDGNGSSPSMNGSVLNGQPLTPNHPTVLTQRGRLTLAREFALDLIPLAAAETPGWQVENLDTWTGPAGEAVPVPYRALVCQPVEGHSTTRHDVWLFSEVGFAMDTAGRVVWDTRGWGHSPAAFHYHRGCFWLRNESLREPVLAGHDTLLARGEILPLASGQTLRIGAHVFTVRIE